MMADDLTRANDIPCGKVGVKSPAFAASVVDISGSCRDSSTRDIDARHDHARTAACVVAVSSCTICVSLPDTRSSFR